MAKIDLKKEMRELYNPPGKPVLADVPTMNYLMIDGIGDPVKSKDYMEAIQTLYPLAYAIKFMVKKQGTDYGVMPLEGLWWADDLEHFLDDRDAWKWTSMIMQPSFVMNDIVEAALEQVKQKKALPAIDKVRFAALDEGKAAQVMHLGPFADERPTIEKLHAFIVENGYERSGKHHEIYLTDPLKTAPGRMKTVIRQPVKLK